MLRKIVIPSLQSDEVKDAMCTEETARSVGEIIEGVYRRT